MSEWPSDVTEELARALEEASEFKPDPARETYIALCHDDPQVDSEGVQALSQAILKGEYGLSEKLVNGVKQLLSREEEKQSSATALLTWTIFGRIPLECCLADDIEAPSQLLGTFQGVALAQDDEEGEAVENEEHEIPTNAEPEPETAPPLPATDYEEVWAAESDPSDFEFDSGYDHQAQVAELEKWVDKQKIDPASLSRPINTSWRSISQATITLLHDLRYHSILKLSPHQWKDERVAERLSQLAMLLVVPSDHHGAVFNEYSASVWQRTSLNAIHTLRDAALADPDRLLKDYLALLRKLIQVNDANEVKPTTSSLAPATWMGVTLLSSLCSHFSESKHNREYNTKIRDTIFTVVDDLTTILETSFESEARPAVPWTMASIFDCISIETLNSAHGQIMLNSGLLREWLSWWDKTSAAQKILIEESTRKLCLSSPTLIGKYVWRYPKFAGSVTRAESNLHQLLWCLTGMHLSTPSSSQIKWKSTAASQDIPPEFDECKKLAWESFQSLCKRVNQALHLFDESTSQRSGGSIEEMTELVDCLGNRTLHAEFNERMAPDKGAIRAELSSIQQILSEMPSAMSHSKRDHADSDSDEMPDGKVTVTDPTRKPKQDVSRLNQLRKSIKALSVSLESAASSSKVD